MSQKKEERSLSGRRVYRAPELKVHGDLRKLTQAKAGTKSDGGAKPSTRDTGGPA